MYVTEVNNNQTSVFSFNILCIDISCALSMCCRGEAPRVSDMWQGVQPELQPHHPQPQTQGRQAVPLPPVPLRLPAQSGPAAAPGAPLYLPLTPQSQHVHGQKATGCVVVMTNSDMSTKAVLV